MSSAMCSGTSITASSIASDEFVNLVDVKSTDPSAQFLPAAAPPSLLYTP
jgi:hypothetical protein